MTFPKLSGFIHFSKTFPGLENAVLKFHDFSRFFMTVRTLKMGCPLRSDRPKHTASISRQLMLRWPSNFDQRPKAGLSSHSVPQPKFEVSVETTFCKPRSIHRLFFPRGQSWNAGLLHLDTEVSVMSIMWRNSRFQPVLKETHVKQTQLKYRRRWGHKAQHPVKCFERARDSKFEWSHELLNGQCTFWRDYRPHSGWVDNCSQERNLLAGRQHALRKIDPES